MEVLYALHSGFYLLEHLFAQLFLVEDCLGVYWESFSRNE